jgi:hypothetical protein
VKRKLLVALLVVVAPLLASYVTSYACVRDRHVLVHTMGCSGGGPMKIERHGVGPGDLVMSRSPAVCFWLFAPLRWAETALWYLREPRGSACPGFDSWR